MSSLPDPDFGQKNSNLSSCSKVNPAQALALVSSHNIHNLPLVMVFIVNKNTMLVDDGT